jgi:type II secretory pathway component PulL
MRTPLAADTTFDVEARQIEAWRAMTPAGKLALVEELNTATRAMMLAGIRHRHPDAGEREVFLRAAIILFGADLAVAAYPDAAAYVAT